MGRRIIPARAGFTLASTRPGQPAPDHPRSRGVYAAAWEPTAWAQGSSPLARGLPPALDLWPEQRRIIPARAGFTFVSRFRFRVSRDHPRSRGVYGALVRGDGDAAGSSPLARGLLTPAVAPPRRQRIIPARAGFTAVLQEQRHDLRDHPRSRGVYTGKEENGNPTQGSSPLARGLQSPGPGRIRAARIIPARAGFT